MTSRLTARETQLSLFQPGPIFTLYRLDVVQLSDRR
jgi:hypothetical protein